MRDISPILKSLDFLESETKVYLAALELGPSTVIEIAKHTRLSRPATYTAIAALADRGLMSTVTRGKRKLFAAEHPDRLLHYAKRKEEELKARVGDLARAVPELALRIGGEKPVVKAFEGKEGILAIVEDYRLTRPKEICEIADVDAMRTVLSSEELAPMREELRRIGTRVRGLLAGNAVQKSSIGADARLLPDGLWNFHGDMTIYGNKVALVTFTGTLHSVVIENADVAKTMQTLFEVAWVAAKDFAGPSA